MEGYLENFFKNENQAHPVFLSEHGSLWPIKESIITECILLRDFTSSNKGPNVTKHIWRYSNN